MFPQYSICGKTKGGAMYFWYFNFLGGRYKLGGWGAPEGGKILHKSSTVFPIWTDAYFHMYTAHFFISLQSLNDWIWLFHVLRVKCVALVSI